MKLTKKCVSVRRGRKMKNFWKNEEKCKNTIKVRDQKQQAKRIKVKSD